MQHLGSPILSKIQQAFMYIRSIALGKAHEEFSSFRAVDGRAFPTASRFQVFLFSKLQV